MKSYKCPQCNKEVEMTPQKKFKLRELGRVFCSFKCYTLLRGIVLGGKKYRGLCKICGDPFESAHGGKIYCSVKCYQADPETATRLQKMSTKGHEARWKKLGIKSKDAGLTKVQCAYCGEIKTIKKSKVRKRNFCNQIHYRKYMADRFDRWIASPQTVALPQNYDEFLTLEILPCPIEGCNWEGNFLSVHANLEHGIPARKFKKLVGFNLGSGLVTPELSERMRQGALERGPNGLTPGPSTIKPFKRTSYCSLEGKEHSTKARILLSTIPTDKVFPCRVCGKPVKQPYVGRKLYCSITCRCKYYTLKKKTHKLTCRFCKEVFLGSPDQKKSNDSDGVVVCSVYCRTQINFNDHRGINYNSKGYETDKRIRDRGKCDESIQRGI